MRKLELTGRRFGRLRVLRLNSILGRKTVWDAVCDCGEVISIFGAYLMAGTKSCGCLQRDAAKKAKTTHGHTRKGQRSREYNIWSHMKKRCYDHSCKCYARYGGRGITVCDRWLKSFTNFLSDMGLCPPKKSIERVNNMLGYTPYNCKWGDDFEQSNNKRNNVVLFVHGQRLTVAQCARSTGLKYATIYRRIKLGEPTEIALRTKLWSRATA